MTQFLLLNHNVPLLEDGNYFSYCNRYVLMMVLRCAVVIVFIATISNWFIFQRHLAYSLSSKFSCQSILYSLLYSEMFLSVSLFLCLSSFYFYVGLCFCVSRELLNDSILIGWRGVQLISCRPALAGSRAMAQTLLSPPA